MFCLESERSISNDWVVRYENRWLQLERSSNYPPRQAKVTVCEWEDGRIEIRYQGRVPSHREIAGPEPKPVPVPPEKPGRKHARWKPSANHPWRKSVLASPSRSSIRPAAAAIQALR